MALDVYSPCPGGTERKIKFCACGKDMANELGRVVDALSGGQRANALGQINRLLDSHGNRACLLALKGSVQLEMQDVEGLKQTAETFSDAHSDNAAAQSMLAISRALEGDTEGAVDATQQAMQLSSQSIHELTHQAIGLVGQQLFAQRKILGARAHLGLYVGALDEEGTHAESLLMDIMRSPQVPLILKSEFQFQRAPEGQVWRESCDAAVDLAERGAWGAARDRFDELSEELSNEPIIWKNLAIVEGILGNEADAADAWRRYAMSDGVPLEEAVEAEALAQFLIQEEVQQLDRIRQTYPFTDIDRVMERLLSDRRLEQIETDLASMATEDRPAPKTGFWLLDREMPMSAEDLQADQVPCVIGQLFVYGRETDREPRIDFVTVRRSEFDTAVTRVKEILGEYGGEMASEEKIGEIPAPVDTLSFQPRFPRDATPQQRRQLADTRRRAMTLEQWPELPQGALDGKSPAELASDPKGRIQVQAAVLIMETIPSNDTVMQDYDLLREKLGLPANTDLDPEGLQIDSLPPCRLHRLPPERLTDDQLTEAFARSTWLTISRAARRLGPELIDRTHLHSRVDLASIYGALGSMGEDLDEALEYTLKAEQAATAAKRSPAAYLFRELELRTMRGESSECQRVFETLQTQHADEPGVRESLYRWLVSIGAITPEGQPAAPGGAVAEQTAEHALAAEESPAQAAPGVWTPGGGEPAPGPKQDKPGLWLPGQ